MGDYENRRYDRWEMGNNYGFKGVENERRLYWNSKDWIRWNNKYGNNKMERN